jgi:hypothetical protein
MYLICIGYEPSGKRKAHDEPAQDRCGFSPR